MKTEKKDTTDVFNVEWESLWYCKDAARTEVILQELRKGVELGQISLQQTVCCALYHRNPLRLSDNQSENIIFHIPRLFLFLFLFILERLKTMSLVL